MTRPSSPKGRLLQTALWSVGVVLLSAIAFVEPIEAQSCVVTTDIGDDDIASALVLQPDGKIVLVGDSDNGTNWDIGLVRYHIDGTLDTSFNASGIVTLNYSGSHDKGLDVTLQSDEKIVIAGHVILGGNDEFTVARFLSNGSLDDPVFGGDGVDTTDIYSSWDLGYGVAVQPDGKIVVAGSAHDGQYDVAVVRYTADGYEDTSFDGDGIATFAIGSGDDYTNSMMLQPDGKILVNGFFDNGTDDDCFVARLNTNGSLDTTFDGDGIVTLDVGTDYNYCDVLSLQSDNKIVVAGHHSNGTDQDIYVARLNTDGSLDNTFASNGIVTTWISATDDNAFGIEVQSDDKIVLAGITGTVGSEDFLVLRYLADGSLDTTFDSDGYVITSIGTQARAWDVAIQPDGKIVVVGDSDTGPDSDFALVRYNTNGTVDDSCGQRYRSVGISPANLNTSTRTVEVYGSTATFSGAMPDNIGVGDVLQYQIGSTYHIAIIHGRTSDRIYTVAPPNGGTPQEAPAGTGVDVYRAYTALSDWEGLDENDALDNSVENFDTSTNLLADGTVMQVACYGDGADSTEVTISGWTTGADNYIRIYTPTSENEVGASQRHEGSWDASKYILESASLAGGGDAVLLISEEYVRVDGLQVHMMTDTGNVEGIGITNGAMGSSYYEISNSIVRGNGTGVQNIRIGINLWNAGTGGVLKAWNNVIYDWAGGSGAVAGIGPDDGAFTFYLYNNTVVDCEEGIANWAGTVIAKNNLVFNNVDNYWGAFDGSSTNNLSGPGADPQCPNCGLQNGVAVTFVDEASDDFHLALADTGARNYGADLSGDANLSFTDDVDSQFRGSTWDIGADEVGPTTFYRSIGSASDYTAGTVTATDGSPVVTGTGTLWLTNNRGRGDRVLIDGTDYTILSVDSETQLTLAAPFSGITASGKAYTISRQFATPEAWETCIDGGPCTYFPVASNNLVSDNRREVGIVYGDSIYTGAVDTAVVRIAGSTTGPDHNITLTADGGNRHYGIAGAGVVFENNPASTSGDALEVMDPWVTVEWIEVTGGPPGSAADGIEVSNIGEVGTVTVRNNLAHDLDGSGIQIDDPLVVVDIYNNITYDTIRRGIHIEQPLTGARILNNTVLRGDTGIRGTVPGPYPTVLLRNNLVHSCSIDDYDVPGLDPASSHNLSGDATATTHSALGTDRPSVPLSGAGGVNFVDDAAPGIDLHIQPGSAAVDVGVNLVTVFSSDIDNALRPPGGLWDIGADEQGMTGNGLTLTDHSAGQTVDKFESAASVIDVLLRFRLIRTGTATVDIIRVNFTTTSGVVNGDVTGGELWIDVNGDGAIDGGDAQIQTGVSPSGGVLTFTTNFIPSASGTNYLVRATVNNLTGSDRTSFSLGIVDIDEVEAGVTETGAVTPAFHAMGTQVNYRSIGTRADYGTLGPEGLTTTVTATAGSTLVTGAGTQWIAANRGRGDRITIEGTSYTILSVDSPTRLTLTAPFGGTTGSGLSYSVSRKFPTLQAWENCLTDTATPCEGVQSSSLVADDRFEVGIAYKDSTFTAGVTIDGATTDADHNITLTVDAGNRHGGVVGGGVVVDGGDTTAGEIQVTADHTVVEWLEVKGVRGGVSSSGVRVIDGNNVLLYGLLSHDNLHGIKVSGAGVVSFTVRNSIIYDNDDEGIDGDNANDTVVVENCTVYGNGTRGLSENGGTDFTVTNTISMNNPLGDFDIPSGTQNYNISKDASASCGTCFPSRTETADSNPGAGNWVIFENITAGSENLHLKGAATDNDAMDAGQDLSGQFTTDIDVATRLGIWDIGADEAGSCSCDLLETARDTNTITVSVPGSFEMTFDTFAGGGIRKFYDLAEDPAFDFAGGDDDGQSPHSLHSFGTNVAATYYNAGNNDNATSSELDLLEATSTRVRVRQRSALKGPVTGVTLPGVLVRGDYSIYPSGRLALRWTRETTVAYTYSTEFHEMMLYETATTPPDSFEVSSQTDDTNPNLWDDDFMLAKQDDPGVVTDFLYIQYKDWASPPYAAQADLVGWTHNGGNHRVNPTWVETTGLSLSAGDRETWDTLTFFKPTDLGDTASPWLDPDVTERSENYRTPDVLSLSVGFPWEDADENTAAGDFFNEAEDAYLLRMNTTTGLTFDIDGAATTRYQPFFKIVEWRSVDDPVVTLEGAGLIQGTDFNADVKPLARAHFAKDLTWHSTLQSSGAVTTPDVGGAGTVNGYDFQPARFGNGARFDTDGEYMSISPANNFDSAEGTIEFWYKPFYDYGDEFGDPADDYAFFGYWIDNDNYFYGFHEPCDIGGGCLGTDEGIQFGIKSGGVLLHAVAGAPPAVPMYWQANEWVHLRFVWKSDGVGASERVEIYLNGQNIIMDKAGTYDTPVPLDTAFYIGERNKDALLINNARGIIDEFRIYSSADAPASLAQGGHTGSSGEYLASASNNYMLDFTAVDGSNRGEYLYLGSDSKFRGVNVQLAAVGQYTVAPNLQWEYWNGSTGAWANLEAVTGFTDQTASFTASDGTIFWEDDPGNWDPYSINGEPDLYYIRAYLAAGDYATASPVERLMKTDVLLFQYCGNIIADAQTFDFSLPEPTAVELVSFEAKSLDEKVELTWETGSEIDNLGFHLYRALSARGPYERMTSALIPGLGSSPEGKQYSYTDTGLTNGVTYYYKLEDVETTGKTQMHGPVWATPQVVEEPGGEEPEGEEETPSGARNAVGQPEHNRLNILESRTGELVLELITEGFYAIPQGDGTVRLEIPEFALTEAVGSPAVPVRRTWVPVLAGRQVSLVSVSMFDEEVFDDLMPETAGAPAIEVGRGGTIRATRQRRQRVTNRVSTYYPEQSAQLLATAFQEDVKKALVEMAPLRWDTARNRLVLAHRLVVRLSLEGRDLAEQTSRSGRRGRRYPRPPTLQEPGRVMTRWVTTEAGLHGVDLSRLLRSRDGAPINPDTLRLSRQGESVPFHIEGTTLYFVSVGGEGNPYGTEAVYELEVGVSGERMPLSSAVPGGAPTAFYWELIRKEENLIYQSALVQAPDRWLWKMLFAPAKESFSFEVSALSPTTETSHLKVWLQGASDFAANPDHHVQIYINGTFLGEKSWNGKEAQELDLEIGAGILHDGENLLEVENVDDTDATYSMVMLNRFEVRYPRRLEAQDGYLEGSWSHSGTAEVTGVASQAHVLEKTATGYIWLEGAEATPSGIRFQAEAEGSYLVVSPDAVKAPTTRRVSKTNRLKTTTQQADYVLIGPREFLGALSPLLNLRRSQGLKAKAVAIEDITSEFGFGEESPQAIKDFLTYAYHSWDQAPRYVVLAGDGTYDFKDNLKTGVENQVPPMMVMTSYLETASDPAYAAVNGEDLLPDLAIGRLPAATVDELQTMVEKIVAFETSEHTFGGRAVLVSDNPDRAGDFVADAEALASTALSSKELERIYLSQLGPAATRNQILQAFNEGASLVNYIGHGGIQLWADEDIFNNDDVQTLALQGEQPLLLTMNCLNGYFHFPYLNALSEELLKADGKGAVAAFSPSGLSVNSAAHIFHRLLLDELVNGGHSRLGDAVLAAQSAYADSGALPEMIAIYHLFGDPAMELQ